MQNHYRSCVLLSPLEPTSYQIMKHDTGRCETKPTSSLLSSGVSSAAPAPFKDADADADTAADSLKFAVGGADLALAPKSVLRNRRRVRYMGRTITGVTFVYGIHMQGRKNVEATKAPEYVVYLRVMRREPLQSSHCLFIG